MKPLSQTIETLIRGNTLARPQDLLDNLKTFKEGYSEATAELTFKDKSLIVC